MLRPLTALATCIAALVALPQFAGGEPSIYPTGTTRYDPAKAYNMYVLFAANDRKTHLIDMDGNEVHHWDYNGFPSGMLDPALTGGARGHIIVQLELIKGIATGVNPGLPSVFSDKTVGELDWDGTVVWQWGDQAPDGAARQHHDWARMKNGDTLLLVNANRSLPGFKLELQLDDAIYEVTPTGDIAWKWFAGDHLGEFGFTPAELRLVKNAADPDYLHLNSMKEVGPNHWFDSGDKRFAPDNILISSRDANFFAIIDRKTGHVVWRIGPHFAPPPPPGPPHLPMPIDQISGQHDPQIIPAGLPGAGNILVFDDQGEAGYPPAPLKVFPGSRILEIDPVKREIVWQYMGSNNDRDVWSFYSAFISDARRLPNGNTFIDEGMNGRMFQITPKGEIVWEYVNPYFGRDPRVLSNSVYRAQPVPYEWVPEGTPHAERAVTPPDVTTFRVPGSQ